MRSTIISAGAVVALTAGPALAVEIPVDLSSWVVDGQGSWTLEGGANGVVQSLNSAPTAFHNNSTSSQGTALAGTIEVQTGTDDDWIGFVLGYEQGDIDGLNPTVDYLLVDWKQESQSGYGAGLAISRVTGAVQAGGTATGSDLWQHTGPVDLITRSNAPGAQYANVGWADNTEYDFDIEFTPTTVKVFVDGVLEIDITAATAGLSAFADGAFGFWNYSQPGVRYAGITEEELPPETNVIPLPGALPLFGAGLAALGLAARRRRG